MDNVSCMWSARALSQWDSLVGWLMGFPDLGQGYRSNGLSLSDIFSSLQNMCKVH